MMIALDSPKLAKITAERSTSVAPDYSKTGRNPNAANQRVAAGERSTSRFAFTKRAIDALPLPENQRAYYHDNNKRGLLLTVYPSGERTFALYRRINGRPERITIGAYPSITIEQARTRVDELNGHIAKGHDPAEERRAVRDEMMLGELFADYLEKHAKVHKRTWQADVAMFNLYLDPMRHRKISSITRDELVTLHRRIGKRGHYVANRAMELISSIFNKGKEWGWQGENPATGLKAFREHKRQRFLDADELPAFFQSLAEEQNTTMRDFVLASLLTGARQANVMSMAWPEIRWGRQVWEISAEKSKSGEAIDVMLTPLMLELLERRRDEPQADPVWVFPGEGKTGHLVEAKSAWARILRRAGIKNLRLHDLRRTLGSWQALLGSSLPIIGASLGHRSLQATQVYARLNADPVRQSVSRAVDAMLEAAQQPVRLLPPLASKAENGNG